MFHFASFPLASRTSMATAKSFRTVLKRALMMGPLAAISLIRGMECSTVLRLKACETFLARIFSMRTRLFGVHPSLGEERIA